MGGVVSPPCRPDSDRVYWTTLFIHRSLFFFLAGEQGGGVEGGGVRGEERGKRGEEGGKKCGEGGMGTYPVDYPKRV